jgi:hypothetical protein
MSAIDPDNLVNRIKDLEAENRRLARETRRIKWIGLATVLGLAVVVGIGGAGFMQPDHIAAHRFLVIDPTTQKVRASLGMEGNNVALRLNDENGGQHPVMFCDRFGEYSCFELNDIDGKRKVHILVDRFGQKIWVNGRIFE